MLKTKLGLYRVEDVASSSILLRAAFRLLGPGQSVGTWPGKAKPARSLFYCWNDGKAWEVRSNARAAYSASLYCEYIFSLNWILNFYFRIWNNFYYRFCTRHAREITIFNYLTLWEDSKIGCIMRSEFWAGRFLSVTVWSSGFKVDARFVTLKTRFDVKLNRFFSLIPIARFHRFCFLPLCRSFDGAGSSMTCSSREGDVSITICMISHSCIPLGVKKQTKLPSRVNY